MDAHERRGCNGRRQQEGQDGGQQGSAVNGCG
jgi:hypothetical protein